MAGAAAGGAAAAEAAWNGDYRSEKRAPKASTCTRLADVVGDALGVGDGTLLPLGSLFAIVDLAAGRASYCFMEGPVVTVSVDYGELIAPVRRGQLVQATARVVTVGSSSITVQVETQKEVLSDAPPRYVPCFNAQLTFVAIDKETGRPYKNVPRLRDAAPGVDSGAARRAAAAMEAKAASRETAQLLSAIDEDPVESLPVAAEDGVPPAPRTSSVSIDDTRVELRKQYLPRHSNFGGSVFGGDLLVLLEDAASYCGKRFARSHAVSCVHLHNIHFRVPVLPTHLLCSVARVVHVGRYCMEVEVVVSIDRAHEGKALETSHVGYFTLIAHDSSGRVCPLSAGLDLATCSVEARRAYVKAKVRLERQHGQDIGLRARKEHWEAFLKA
jgi:acyl-CoA thioesterase YciA